MPRTVGIFMTLAAEGQYFLYSLIRKPIFPQVANQLYLSWDLGAAMGIGGYFSSGTEFYTSIGPGISFGRQNKGVRGDFSIRFQHIGTGLNALLFRIGLGF